MLFSQKDLADKLSNNFECAWEELRPAPKVRVDFGNGHVLERTVNGNVATLFLTPEGNVFDVLPGIMETATYDRLVTDIGMRYGALPRGDSNKQLRAIREQALALTNALALWPAGLQVSFDSKVALEGPLKQLAELEPKAKGALHAGASGEKSVNPTQQATESSSVAAAKRVVELPVKESLTGNYLTPEDKVVLRRDSQTAETKLRPQALGLLANQPVKGGEPFTDVLFREVLHVDLKDPFLGLAPDRIGGRLGRYGPLGPDGPVPATR